MDAEGSYEQIMNVEWETTKQITLCEGKQLEQSIILTFYNKIKNTILSDYVECWMFHSISV